MLLRLEINHHHHCAWVISLSMLSMPTEYEWFQNSQAALTCWRASPELFIPYCLVTEAVEGSYCFLRTSPSDLATMNAEYLSRPTKKWSYYYLKLSDLGKLVCAICCWYLNNTIEIRVETVILESGHSVGENYLTLSVVLGEMEMLEPSTALFWFIHTLKVSGSIFAFTFTLF